MTRPKLRIVPPPPADDVCHRCDERPATAGGTLCDTCRRIAEACDPQPETKEA